jgi:hypothetical protein
MKTEDTAKAATPSKPTFEATVIEPVKPPVSPDQPAAIVLPGLRSYNVSDGEGHSGVVQATDVSSAKYRFMREQKICDRAQTWTITPV